MTRSRNSLHKSKLGEFRVWLQNRGWNAIGTKNCWEVLRMTHPLTKSHLIVYTRMEATEHYTIQDLSYQLFKIWQTELKMKDRNNGSR